MTTIYSLTEIKKAIDEAKAIREAKDKARDARQAERDRVILDNRPN